MVRNGEDMDLKREVIRNLIVDGVIRLRGGTRGGHPDDVQTISVDYKVKPWTRAPANLPEYSARVAELYYHIHSRRRARLNARVLRGVAATAAAAYGVHKLRSGKFYPDPKPKGKNFNKSKTKIMVRDKTWREKHDEGRLRVSRSMRLNDLWYSLSYYLMDTACPMTTATTGYWNIGTTPGTSWTMITLTNFVTYSQGAGQGKPLYSEVATANSLYLTSNIYYGSTVTPYYGPFCSNNPTYPTQPTIASNAGFGPFNTAIYNFIADWPWTVMWWDTACNNSSDTMSYLRMRSDTQFETTDPKFPVTYGTFAANKDWQKLVVFGCQWDMKFTNYSGIDHTVEVLFYKMIPDPHAVNYGRACGLPYSQMQNMDQYCQGTFRSMGNKQINVIKRDRFVIRGSTNWMMNLTEVTPSFLGVVNTRNIVKKKYKIKRHYSMNREINNPNLEASAQNYPTSTDYEYNFFNTYYKLEEGVFCRMQAWPSASCEAIEYLPGSNKTVVWDLMNTYNQMCTPIMLDQSTPATNTAFLAQKKPCVGVSMSKKAFFKFDRPLLKGPFLP